MRDYTLEGTDSIANQNCGLYCDTEMLILSLRRILKLQREKMLLNDICVEHVTNS